MARDHGIRVVFARCGDSIGKTSSPRILTENCFPAVSHPVSIFMRIEASATVCMCSWSPCQKSEAGISLPVSKSQRQIGCLFSSAAPLWLAIVRCAINWALSHPTLSPTTRTSNAVKSHNRDRSSDPSLRRGALEHGQSVGMRRATPCTCQIKNPNLAQYLRAAECVPHGPPAARDQGKSPAEIKPRRRADDGGVNRQAGGGAALQRKAWPL